MGQIGCPEALDCTAIHTTLFFDFENITYMSVLDNCSLCPLIESSYQTINN
jgi:hypothetical protein